MKNKPTKLPDDVDIESHGPLPTTNDAAPRKNGPFRSPPTKKNSITKRFRRVAGPVVCVAMTSETNPTIQRVEKSTRFQPWIYRKLQGRPRKTCYK